MPRRFSSLAWLLPLGLFLIFHLWENWASLSGRGVWLDRAQLVGWPIQTAIGAIFAAALVAHLALRLRSKEPGYGELLGSRGLRNVQRVTGVMALLFFGYHLYHVLPAQFSADAVAGGAYDVLWNDLGEPAVLFIYVVGISAVYFHLAHGLCRAAVKWGVVSNRKTLIAARYAAGAIGFLLWTMSLQLVSRFALGQGLFG